MKNAIFASSIVKITRRMYRPVLTRVNIMLHLTNKIKIKYNVKCIMYNVMFFYEKTHRMYKIIRNNQLELMVIDMDVEKHIFKIIKLCCLVCTHKYQDTETT